MSKDKITRKEALKRAKNNQSQSETAKTRKRMAKTRVHQGLHLKKKK